MYLHPDDDKGMTEDEKRRQRQGQGGSQGDQGGQGATGSDWDNM